MLKLIGLVAKFWFYWVYSVKYFSVMVEAQSNAIGCGYNHDQRMQRAHEAVGLAIAEEWLRAAYRVHQGQAATAWQSCMSVEMATQANNELVKAGWDTARIERAVERIGCRIGEAS